MNSLSRFRGIETLRDGRIRVSKQDGAGISLTFEEWIEAIEQMCAERQDFRGLQSIVFRHRYATLVEEGSA